MMRSIYSLIGDSLNLNDHIYSLPKGVRRSAEVHHSTVCYDAVV